MDDTDKMKQSNLQNIMNVLWEIGKVFLSLKEENGKTKKEISGPRNTSVLLKIQ